MPYAAHQTRHAETFRALHARAGAFVIPNPWDAGTARLLAMAGFPALATTSAGYAYSRGLPDNAIGRDAMLEHIAVIAAAGELPVSADLENGFGDAPEIVAETIRLAAEAGAVGGSIEDATWVATRAASVAAVLGHPACRVRPLDLPVPPALRGTSAGALFGELVRMNDGALRHQVPKQALHAALAQIDVQALRGRAATLAAAQLPALDDPDALNAWCIATPVRAVADLLGFDEPQLDDIAASVVDFIAALSPLSDAASLARASDAARQLLDRMTVRVAQSHARDGTLVAAVKDAAAQAGWHASGALVANLVGLLSQTCEATAAWLANTIVAWHRQSAESASSAEVPDDATLDAFVAEVARFDTPVQNTRRFVAARTTLEGVTLDAGAAILVVLAAANRDPAVHRDPHRFVPTRTPGPDFGFGTGPHQCPGARIAQAVTVGAFGALLRAGGWPPREALKWDYRASANIRMPKFDAAR
ncbi:cytochrome P450 [Burkholderia multivorans]|uniref:cytochrome P450 n=1 Tax=Burkholderia multivorans TaxID=87883 RepID=UPI0002780BED|nr:cytochrome P450 [Burkholderia multivorans]EJO62376.1 unspecific monooxygenase domain protein [Burkholderia multivorans CF2]MCA8219913.1 cytochrome P450 [Burkholderia multivorans]MDR8877315.1 Biotin biosynthesis cytochrome P450 [Burkholderia multivorans]MDR8881383.1 Biotin biosynthesis cytochrome P450 [Burkholderia multivorans]MDR8888479.1 Biotin biosynthesis cytochrome P450 [Burkholderia multivorans]